MDTLGGDYNEEPTPMDWQCMGVNLMLFMEVESMAVDIAEEANKVIDEFDEDRERSELALELRLLIKGFCLHMCEVLKEDGVVFKPEDDRAALTPDTLLTEALIQTSRHSMKGRFTSVLMSLAHGQHYLREDQLRELCDLRGSYFIDVKEIERQEYRITTLLSKILRELDLPESVEISINEVDSDRFPWRDLGDVSISCHPYYLVKIVEDFITNSVAAMSGKGRIDIGIDETEEHVEITIEDDGAGISEADMSRVFDDGYTTKEGGTGIGLGQARNYILGTLKGGLSLESKEGAGAIVKLKIPKVRDGLIGIIKRAERKAAANLERMGRDQKRDKG